MEQRVIALVVVLAAGARAQSVPVVFDIDHYPAGDGPRAAAAADFDGNGRIDLAVANSVSGQLATLLAGPGGFSAATYYAAGTSPWWVSAGDLDSDGVPDAVVSNNGSGDVSVFLGTGTGSFGTGASVAVGSQPRKIELADFDLDGDLDLASGNYSAKTIAILLGLGNGQFQSPTAFALPGATSYIDAGDLNGDGMIDLAAGAAVLQTVEFLMNQGGGAFALGPSLHTFTTGPNYTTWLALGDFDNDADADLVITDEEVGFGEALWASFKNDGSGSFCCIAFLGGCCGKTNELGDFDGDGKLDHLDLWSSNLVEIRLGLGNGLFAVSKTYGVGFYPSSALLADVNQDGMLDCVTSNTQSDTVSVLINGCTEPSIGSVSPSTVVSLSSQGAVVWLQGCLLGTATSVVVDGQPLASSAFTLVDIDRLKFDMPLVSKLGRVDVQVVTPQGTASAQIDVIPPFAPLIVLATTGPPLYQMFTATGANLKSGASPGDVVFLAASLDLIPTSIPGIASFAIGRGGTSLVHVSTLVMPPKAWTEQVFPLAGLPLGVPIYLQAGVLSAATLSLPLKMTSVQQGVIVN